MPEKIRAFPFEDLPTAEDDPAYHKRLRAIAFSIGQHYIRGAHQDVETMLSVTNALPIYQSLAKDLAIGYWGTLHEAGIAPHSALFDKMLDAIMIQCSLIAWMAFSMGREYQNNRDEVDRLLDGIEIDLGGEGDGLG